MRKALIGLAVGAGLLLLWPLVFWAMALFDHVAGFLAPDHFVGPHRWFRAVLILAGAVAILSLLRVAVRDRQPVYLASVALCLLVFVVAGRTGAPPTPAQQQAAAEARERALVEDRERFRRSREEAAAREAAALRNYEPAIRARMMAIARIAASADSAGLERAMETLSAEIGRRPGMRRHSSSGGPAYRALRRIELEHSLPARHGESTRKRFEERLRLHAAAVAEEPTNRLRRYERAVWLYSIHELPAEAFRDEDASADAPVVDRRRAWLETAREEFAAAIAHGMAGGAAWYGWGLTWVDDDPELAVGGMALGEIGFAHAGEDVSARLQRVRLRMLGGRRGQRDYVRILQARAMRIASDMLGAEIADEVRQLAAQPLPAPSPLPPGIAGDAIDASATEAR